ncbi:MAG: hypothetical protein OEW29_05810 [Acidimicrobiia bacterium]|nr:hypothetical protein [Acidimicrobiia bacterium]
MQYVTRYERFVLGDFPMVCARSGLPASKLVPVQARRDSLWPWLFFPGFAFLAARWVSGDDRRGRGNRRARPLTVGAAAPRSPAGPASTATSGSADGSRHRRRVCRVQDVTVAVGGQIDDALHLGFRRAGPLHTARPATTLA